MRRLLRRATLAAALAAGAGVLALGWLAVPRVRLLDPAPTRFLTDRRGEFLAEIGGGDSGELGFWELGPPPTRIVRATLAAEDGRFSLHPGVDPLALARALYQNATTGRRVSGASTLAMQVARMQDPGSRTYGRKFVEMATALGLTARYGRDAILAQYLRLAPYGRRVRGARYAARRYFQKPLEDLSWAEAALLAALPQAPSSMDPHHDAGRVRGVKRARRILDTLARTRHLSAEDRAGADRELDALGTLEWEERPREALHAVLRLEAAPPPRVAPGPERTTLDLDLQRRVQRTLRRAATRWRARGVENAAAVVLEVPSGAVRASVGSTDYDARDRKGRIDFTRVPRSSGSTLKPFLYARALELGHIDPGTILDDARRARGGIANADASFLGPLLPRVALANSRNVPAAGLVGRVGVEEAWSQLHLLGLHDASLPAAHYGNGVALGTLAVRLEDLARAYLALARGGTRVPLRWLEGAPPAPGRQIMERDVATLVTRWIGDPAARLPSFPRMGHLEYPFPVATKTGTSSDHRDAWCVAFSGRYLVAVWIGHPDARPMQRVSGYHFAAPLARAILLSLHPEESQGLGEQLLPPPEGWGPVPLCLTSGARATPACPRSLEEHFPPGSEVRDPCEVHRRLSVDARNGLLAHAHTPAAHREERVFAALPARFARWGRDRGLKEPPVHVSDLDRLDPGAPLPGPPPGVRPALADARPVRIQVTSPERGSLLYRDPEAPPTRSTIALDAIVDPPGSPLLWYVDGEPFAETRAGARPPRWPLAPGEHVIQARVPYTPFRSAAVRVRVQ